MDHEKIVDIKQRMIGAIIIISLAIIILPIIFSPKDDLTEHFEVDQVPPISTEIKKTITHYDKKPKQLDKMPTLPVPSAVPVDEMNKLIVNESQKTDGAALVEDSQSVEDSQLVKDASSQLDKPPVVKDEKNAQYTQAQKPKQDTLNKAYTLQLGSFSQQDNALTLTNKLQAKKFKAYIEKVNLATGTSYRVRIGPFLTYEQIALIQRKIKRQFKIDGKIVNY